MYSLTECVYVSLFLSVTIDSLLLFIIKNIICIKTHDKYVIITEIYIYITDGLANIVWNSS